MLVHLESAKTTQSHYGDYKHDHITHYFIVIKDNSSYEKTTIFTSFEPPAIVKEELLGSSEEVICSKRP